MSIEGTIKAAMAILRVQRYCFAVGLFGIVALVFPCAWIPDSWCQLRQSRGGIVLTVTLLAWAFFVVGCAWAVGSSAWAQRKTKEALRQLSSQQKDRLRPYLKNDLSCRALGVSDGPALSLVIAGILFLISAEPVVQQGPAIQPTPAPDPQARDNFHIAPWVKKYLRDHPDLLK